MKILCPYPACAQKIEIEESHASSTAHCPTCGGVFQCPPLESFVEDQPLQAEPEVPPRKRPRKTSPKQAALLSYLGLPVPPTLAEASESIDAAIEDGRYEERLSRWRQDRLKLYPELYGQEVAEQKHARAKVLHAFVNCDVGSEFHPLKRISLLQASRAVEYLDVTFSGWDSSLWEEFGPSVDAVWDWFIPGVALTSPKTVKKMFRGRFALPPGAEPVEAPPPSRRSSSQGCFHVVVLGLAMALCGLGFLGVRTLPPPKSPAEAPVPPELCAGELAMAEKLAGKKVVLESHGPIGAVPMMARAEGLGRPTAQPIPPIGVKMLKGIAREKFQLVHF